MNQYEFEGRAVQLAVEITHEIVPVLGGVSMCDFYLDNEACAQAFRVANPKIDALFEYKLPRRTVFLPPLSYGHVVALGAKLEFPSDGEPNVKPIADSIASAIAIITERDGQDFEQIELVQFYRQRQKFLQESFPEEQIRFSLGSQGPITTAMLLRGQDFLLDIYDEPELSKIFLTRITESIVKYNRWIRQINNEPEITLDGAFLADDFASLLAPEQWPDWVIPFWNRFFAASSVGQVRELHCENLTPHHLPKLKMAGLTYFQPSVSPALSLSDMSKLGIEFDWLLYSFRIGQMSKEEIAGFVSDAVRAKASCVRTQFGAWGYEQSLVPKIIEFVEAFEPYESLKNNL